MNKEQAFSVNSIQLEGKTWVTCYHCKVAFEYIEVKRKGSPLNQFYGFWFDKAPLYDSNNVPLGKKSAAQVIGVAALLWKYLGMWLTDQAKDENMRHACNWRSNDNDRVRNVIPFLVPFVNDVEDIFIEGTHFFDGSNSQKVWKSTFLLTFPLLEFRKDGRLSTEYHLLHVEITMPFVTLENSNMEDLIAASSVSLKLCGICQKTAHILK